MAETVPAIDRRLTDPKHVFGFAPDAKSEGFERDKMGRPIENGIGSPGRPTAQHYQAIVKYGKTEAERAKAQEDLNDLLAGRQTEQF